MTASVHCAPVHFLTFDVDVPALCLTLTLTYTLYSSVAVAAPRCGLFGVVARTRPRTVSAADVRGDRPGEHQPLMCV